MILPLLDQMIIFIIEIMENGHPEIFATCLEASKETAKDEYVPLCQP
jgi:hypothetical protein